MAGHLALVLLLAVGAGIGGATIVWGWRIWQGMRRERFIEAACRMFHWQREHLEAKFFYLVMQRGLKEGRNYVDCSFDDHVLYARNKLTGQLSALVGVRLEVEEQRAGLRHAAHSESGVHIATAVFRFDGRRWDTNGRAIMNLTPAEAIHFYKRDLEVVGHEWDDN